MAYPGNGCIEAKNSESYFGVLGEGKIPQRWFQVNTDLNARVGNEGKSAAQKKCQGANVKVKTIGGPQPPALAF